jgi:hypothetical protein
MKRNLLVAALLVSASVAFGQGTINFNDRQVNGTAGTAQAPVVAPIFGLDNANPTAQKNGLPDQTWYNGATVGGVNGPVLTDGLGHGGTAGLTYGGSLLQGTGFSVALWAVTSSNPDSALDPNSPANAQNGLVPGSLTSFDATTRRAYWGFFNAPVPSPSVPGVVGGASDPTRIKYQVRAWDNKGGTITTWAQVLADPTIAHGYSAVTLLDQPLGAGSTLPPNLLGFQSFQLFVVPEPSVIALGVLGAGCLFMLRRRK